MYNKQIDTNSKISGTFLGLIGNVRFWYLFDSMSKNDKDWVLELSANMEGEMLVIPHLVIEEDSNSVEHAIGYLNLTVYNNEKL